MTLAAEVVGLLKQRGETLSFCESLTAGLGSATIAEVPGASAVLRGGLVTYATDLKSGLAGVDTHLLDREGPVSPETARQMAAGARRVCGSDWAVSFTGVAGPDPQDGHEPGEVFIAVAGPDGVRSERARIDGRMHLIAGVEHFAGDRPQIREWSVQAGLYALVNRIQGTNGKGASL
ncbi:CinA family protein [Corynebacterium doosanense]|uniref:Lipoprotein n=1 Tax=Corynebacterium doosanense CAU 212 = DSM 45436 TaxID=558173 RepID=A0A097IGN8_9CORY|nr:CinA family protein [Corynebacterium doosanense]AIT61311.1 lipoprotein [Corynebacterium doosanense CAU 212 = DSM 45436]